jgi:hypothetical protein
MQTLRLNLSVLLQTLYNRIISSENKCVWYCHFEDVAALVEEG